METKSLIKKRKMPLRDHEQTHELSTMKFCQAWMACIIAMNGGISLYHATVAAKTGLVSATGAWITTIVPGSYKDWKSNVVFTFFTTFIGDILVVPTHYGPVWPEATVTGLLASLFAIMTIGVRHYHSD